MSILGGLGMLAGGAAAKAAGGGAVGMGLGAYNDKRQLKQQEKLQKQQIKGAKEMGEFNRELAMKTWEDTNYKAQREQMAKAGLNVGLMYGGSGGGGGTVASGGGGNVTGATATQGGGGEIGMAMQAGLQMQLMQAQKENIEADTKNKEANTIKTAGVDTEAVNTQIQSTLQGITNAKTQNELMGIQKKMAEVELGVAEETAEERITQAETLTSKLIAETKSAEARGEIDQATVNTLIEQYNKQLELTKAQIAGTEAGTIATKAGTKQTEQNIKNLEATEAGQILMNGMRAAGIEPSDNKAFRVMTEVFNKMKVTPEKVGRKMKAIITWLKGQNGTQDAERLKEILNEE